MVLNNMELEIAKGLINEFTINEYGHIADFSDLKHIGVCYTTLTDDEIDIQVEIDLENMKRRIYIGNVTGTPEKIEDITFDDLSALDFDSMCHECSDLIDEINENHDEETEVYEHLPKNPTVKEIDGFASNRYRSLTRNLMYLNEKGRAARESFSIIIDACEFATTKKDVADYLKEQIENDSIVHDKTRTNINHFLKEYLNDDVLNNEKATQQQHATIKKHRGR